jgi:antitoxin ParD1/3/4
VRRKESNVRDRTHDHNDAGRNGGRGEGAVAAGDYATTSEVVRAALRDWKTKRALQFEELAALKADIDAGLADVAAGRVKDFDAAGVVERGRKLLADRLPSA